MKNTLFSIGFAAVVGCNASLQQQQNTNPQTFAAAAAAPVAPVVQPLSKEDSSRYLAPVKAFFEKALLTRSFNGGVLIAKGNAVIYEHYTGYKDPRFAKEEINEETPMHVASVSKTFTGTAVLKLVQEGKIKLDDPLSTYFPNFPYEGVTVEMLLDHRSGLPNYVNYLQDMGWEKDKFATNQDVLNTLYQWKPAAQFKPGTHFRYCNTNFMLLSLIVEKVTGQLFPDYMKKNIFEPLDMKDTYIFTMAADSATATRSFQGNRLWEYDCTDNTYGDKNVYTTPRDLLKWARAISSGSVIRQSLLDSAFTASSNEKRSVHNYGLGWRLLDLPNGKKVIYHNGRWHGSNAAFAMLPEEDVTIIIIGNKFNTNIYSVARKSYDLFGNYLQNGKGSEDDENEATAHHTSRHHYKKSYANSHSKKGVKKSYAKKSVKHKTYAHSSRSIAGNSGR